METQSNGDEELHSRESAAHGRPQTKLRRVVKALESTKDDFAQELSRLKAFNESIPTNQSCQMMEGSLKEANELPQCPALLQNLLKEREVLSQKLQQQNERFEELQRKLEQEHAEKLEAQICVNVLNETIRAALQGEKFLVEQNQDLVLDQQALCSKLEELSRMRLPASQTQIKDLEATSNGMKQDELVGVLHNKVWIRGLWVFAELMLFCHAIIWCLVRTLKETHTFAPT